MTNYEPPTPDEVTLRQLAAWALQEHTNERVREILASGTLPSFRRRQDAHWDFFLVDGERELLVASSTAPPAELN
jgi:hypothetical protein